MRRSDNPNVPRSEKTIVDGKVVPFMAAGNPLSKPLLIVQGFAIHGRIYRDLMRTLAERGFYVLAAAQPGTKGTPNIDPAIEARAAWHWRFLDQILGSRQVTLLGHSQGGLIELGMLAQKPERVALAVLAATPGPIWKYENGKAIPMQDRPMHDWLGAFFKVVMPGNESFGNHLRTTGLVGIRWAGDAGRNIVLNPWGMWGQLLALTNANVQQLADKATPYKGPIEVVFGSNDSIALPDSVKSLARALRTEAKEMHANHSGPGSNPEELMRVIGDALQAVLSGNNLHGRSEGPSLAA